MNNKHFIGEKAKRFESLGPTDPIEGVLLKVDGETAYAAGDQTGYVLEAECPYGTQAMAEAVLAAVRGQSYAGFEAEGARLPAEAELGDGVTVKGMYGPLVRRRVRFGGELSADIGAPAGGDMDHEFGYTDPVKRQIELAEARGRSYIDRKADEIRIGVEDLDKAIRAELALKVGVNDNGQIVSMLNASADEINISGDRFTLDSTKFKVAADGTVTMTGANVTGAVNATKFTVTGKTSSADLDVVNDWFGIDIRMPDGSQGTEVWAGEMLKISAEIGMMISAALYAEKFYTNTAYIANIIARAVDSGVVFTNEIYIDGKRGQWKEITDGSGNKITVLCQA